MSRNYTNQNVPYMIWHKSLLWTFVLNHDQSGIWLCNLCFRNPDPNDRVIFIISCSWLPCPVGWLTETSWSTAKQSKLPNVLFSKTQISSHLFWISLKLTIICYINLIKSMTIIKKWMDKYFLHCDFSQEWAKFQE